jgi:hypothetical protein
MSKRRITRRTILGAGVAGTVGTPALAKVFPRSAGGPPGSSGGVSLITTTNGTRPLGTVVAGGTSDYISAAIIAVVTNGPGNPNDNLRFWSSATGDVGSPIYLNNSTTPPASGISSATVSVPSVPGTVWNAQFYTGTIVPVTTNWTLRFYSGASPGTVLASVPISIDILKRTNPYFKGRGQDGFNSATTVMFTRIARQGTGSGGGFCPICAGTMQASMLILFAPPVANTVTIQYTIDDLPVGTYVTGPSVGGASESYLLSIDTTAIAWNGGTGIPDGTHSLGTKLIDYVGGSAGSNNLPYMWRCIQQPFIVHNNAGTSLATLYSGPQVMPSADPGFGPNWRLNSSALDFLTFPGLSSLPNGIRNTAHPIPSPQSGFIPPVCTSGPFFGTPSALRDASNMYADPLGHVIESEYTSTQRFHTTPVGGVYIWGYTAESSQTQEAAYKAVIQHFNYDGQRDDCLTDPFTTAIDGHDGTFWLCTEVFGRIIKITFDGTVTTLAGGTLDRTKLPLVSSTYDNSITEAQINAQLTQVGTIVSPSFSDLKGSNDLVYDPSSPNIVYVAIPTSHIIVKVVWPGPGLHQGSPTMTRYAGQDSGLGGTGATGTNGGYVDGPATEFVAGTQVAHFMGSITGGVLTVISGYGVDSGSGLTAGCPLSWLPSSPNTTTGNLVTAHLSGSGNGSTWQTNVATNQASVAMTASQPVALLSGPYSAVMADGTGPDLIGTMYIADCQNCAIRKISPDGTMVTTLFGNQTNLPNYLNIVNVVGSMWIGAFGNFTVSSLTWSAGVATIVTSAPVTNTGHTIAPYWTVVLVGGPFTNPVGAFHVASVTDGQHFTLTMSTDPGTVAPNSVTLTAYFEDIYTPTNPVARLLNHSLPNEVYCIFPQRLVWSSAKHLVICGTWSLWAQEVDLSANTIRFIGTYGATVPFSRINVTSLALTTISWFPIDVDNRSAVAPGSVNDPTAGCVGPLDDILCYETGGLSGVFWRLSWDGTVTQSWGGQDPNRITPLEFGVVTGSKIGAGIGHYPWTITISRHQGRILSSGLSETGLSAARILNTAYDLPANTSDPLYSDPPTINRGRFLHLQGSIQDNVETDIAGIFPWGVRPGGMQRQGDQGYSALGLTSLTPGQSNTDTFDSLNLNFPDDASLAAFIQSGYGGAISRPEFTGDDLADLIYYIRRLSMSGSGLGTGTVPVRAPYQSDTTAPMISSVTAARQSATSIQVTWHTDKPTYGCAAAGFASAHGTSWPYHIFKMEPYLGSTEASYNTSHSVVLTGLQVSVTTYLIVVAKDMAGNNSIWAEQTVT